jgi:triosephosphate isomerase
MYTTFFSGATMNPSYFFIANWKMQLPLLQAIAWATDHAQNLADPSQSHTLIICPSFEALYPLQKKLNKTNISLGAQNCSAYTKGAYTGEVSAQSLAEVGCQFCIVGHSERRALFHENNHDIALKVEQLLLNKICPIVCIGETEQEKKNGQTVHIIKQQLDPVLTQIKKFKSPFLLIAYEPIWAIGSGKIPDASTVKTVFGYISHMVKEIAPHAIHKLIYGGSISSSNVQQFTRIQQLNGLLIGSTSLDFQELKKIVLLCK